MAIKPTGKKSRRKVLTMSAGALVSGKFILGTATAKNRPRPKNFHFGWERLTDFLYENFSKSEARITIDIVKNAIKEYNKGEIERKTFGKVIQKKIINHPKTPESTRALTYDSEVPDEWTKKGDVNEPEDGITTSGHCDLNYRPLVYSDTRANCDYVQSCSHSDEVGYHEAGYRTWAFGSASIEQLQRAYLGREDEGGTHRIAAEIDYNYQIASSVSVEFWLWLIDHGSGNTYKNQVYSSSVSDSGREEISSQFHLTRGHPYSAAVYTVGETSVAGSEAAVWDMNISDRGFNVVNNRIEDTLIEGC